VRFERAIPRQKGLDRGRTLGTRRATLAILLAALGAVACRRSSPEELASGARGGAAAQTAPSAPQVDAISPPSAQVEKAALVSGYDVPRRSDTEVRTLLQTACKKAHAAERPLLLEVGADWCSDCRLLHKLERAEPLASTLASFEQVTLNLGEDAQEWLRDAFRIKAIARWLVFRPADCDAKVESWMPLASRVVEPASNGKGSNAETLVSWLEKGAVSPTGAP